MVFYVSGLKLCGRGENYVITGKIWERFGYFFKTSRLKVYICLM
ncbi:Hypothetical protein CpCap5W_1796 [Corynebacterium pseudotuberculosis]|nr:Hypothetical protein Cp3995_0919 [Corynebacterium pseudotuberculosis 3/99-5]AFH51841.1 Hypothetical protein Cp267_0941 [Corynebacterium pseudotuberculosis 267]APZ32460.1 Hypothetical protein CpMEX1_1752 [Corynebacterium pseudotuberculosis]AZN20591.1 hypothetical protein CpCap1W_1792 [Corynebacterium pseudotuberculosis]AZN22696.1 Hypothetical protein CpOviAF1_1797 [Corynebacterium pseudotuberculosis]